MRLVLCVAVHLVVACAACADERYFVTLYASQRSNREPQLTHSFALFSRAEVDSGSSEEGGALHETFTISWMPASGVIRLLAPPETGKNFTLAETLEWASRHGLRTTAWGPFEVSKEVYDRAWEQKNRLESGAVRYKALDRRFRGGGAVNCIHAVSDVIPGVLLSTGSAAGEAATALILRHYRPHLIEPEQVHRWVLHASEGTSINSSE